jgi:hypothetical protein
MQQRVLEEQNIGSKGGRQYRNPQFYLEFFIQQPQIHEPGRKQKEAPKQQNSHHSVQASASFEMSWKS